MVDKNILNKLDSAFQRGARGKLISDDTINQIGTMLVNDYVNKGKKFSLSTVVEILKTNKIVDHSDKKDPAKAYSSTAYSVLRRLGLYKPTEKAIAKAEAKKADTKNE